MTQDNGPSEGPFEATWIKPTLGGAILRLILVVASSAIVVLALVSLFSIVAHELADA